MACPFSTMPSSLGARVWLDFSRVLKTLKEARRKRAKADVAGAIVRPVPVISVMSRVTAGSSGAAEMLSACAPAHVGRKRAEAQTRLDHRERSGDPGHLIGGNELDPGGLVSDFNQKPDAAVARQGHQRKAVELLPTHRRPLGEWVIWWAKDHQIVAGDQRGRDAFVARMKGPDAAVDLAGSCGWSSGTASSRRTLFIWKQLPSY